MTHIKCVGRGGMGDGGKGGVSWVVVGLRWGGIQNKLIPGVAGGGKG